MTDVLSVQRAISLKKDFAMVRCCAEMKCCSLFGRDNLCSDLSSSFVDRSSMSCVLQEM